MPPRRQKQQPSNVTKFLKLFLLLALAFAFKLFLSWGIRKTGLAPAHRSALDDLAAATDLAGDDTIYPQEQDDDLVAGHKEEPGLEAAHEGGGADAGDSQPETPAQFLTRSIAANRVIVFSKSYCPYSMRGKAVMRKHLGEGGVEVVELDGRPDMAELQDELQRITGGRTVPRIFVDQQFIGGADDVAALDSSGNLERLLLEKGLITA